MSEEAVVEGATFDEMDLYDAALDYVSLEEWLKEVEVGVYKTSLRDRLIAKRKGVKRYKWEVHLATREGSLFVLFGLDDRDEVEAAYQVMARGPESFIQWVRIADYLSAEHATNGQGSAFRFPLVIVSSEEMLRSAGVLPNEIVETTEVLDVVRSDGETVQAAAGARLKVSNVWPGVQRGVICTSLTSPTAPVTLEPSQFRVVERADGQIARNPGGTYVHDAVTGCWHAVTAPPNLKPSWVATYRAGKGSKKVDK